LPDSIENPPPPKATICRGAVFMYSILDLRYGGVLIQPSELDRASLAPVYRGISAGSGQGYGT